MIENTPINITDNLGLTENYCLLYKEKGVYCCGETVCASGDDCCEDGVVTPVKYSYRLGRKIRCCPKQIAEQQTNYDACILEVYNTYQTLYTQLRQTRKEMVEELERWEGKCVEGCKDSWSVDLCEFKCYLAADVTEANIWAGYLALVAIVEQKEIAEYEDCKFKYPCANK